MESYFGVAKELGISKKEIGAAQAIVMAVSAGQIRAKFREVRKHAAKKSKQIESDGR
jgi:hypothetical protein